MAKQLGKRVAYQGTAGAYSSLAAHTLFPQLPADGYPTFDDVVTALKREKASIALLPIENSTTGRVADIHHLLPENGLSIIGEHFQPVRHSLIGTRNATKKDIRYIYSHREALAQCTAYIRSLGAEPIPFGDTAGAVKYIVSEGRKDCAAIASAHAAMLYSGAKVLQKDVQDDASNVTRFLILTRKQKTTPSLGGNMITSLVYKTRDVPAALFKTLGGFATAGVNIIKIESFVPMARHTDAHFYIEFEGHPGTPETNAALSELDFYTKSLEILGSYPKSPYRRRFTNDQKKA